MSTSNSMTVVALLNAMIGGTILILPLLVLKAGIVVSVLVLIISSLFNYYSCKICLDHLKGQVDVPQSIEKHTEKRIYSLIYDIFCFFSIICIVVLYFDLIVKQWNGLTKSKSIVNPLLNCIFLFVITFLMRKFQLGVSLLAYGIISIFGYLTFLIWMFSERSHGPHTIKWLNWNCFELIDALGTALSLQGIFVPILKKNKNQQSYNLLMQLTYLMGIIIYGSIGFFGAGGLVNRNAMVFPTQTVQDYFKTTQWEVFAIEALYLIHLYSVFPQYLLISKTRFYGIIGKKEKQDIELSDYFFIGCSICICLVVNLGQVSIQVILAINGAVFGFFFTYLMPISLHLYCKYKTFNEKLTTQVNLVQFAENKEIQINKQTPRYFLTTQTIKSQIDINNTKKCQEDQGWCSNILIICMSIYGLASLIYSVVELIRERI